MTYYLKRLTTKLFRLRRGALGGTPEVKLVSGKVEKGQTTISFTLPMTPSSTKYNYTFTTGERIPIILAYGKNGAKKFTSYHQYRASAEIKLPT